MLYFDHAATTSPSPDILDTYLQVSQQYFANPSSAHNLGQEAHHLLLKARQQFAELLQFDPEEIYFTSSGTESNNWALQSLLNAHAHLHPEKKQVILSAVEHPSILYQMQHLKEDGFEVLLAPVDQYGQVDVQVFKELLNDQVLFVSTMLVNNEVGALLPVEQIAQCLSTYPQIIWHVDAVQAVSNKMKSMHHPRIDLLSLSSHKFHSVRGVGLLAIRKRVSKKPLLYGGGQEGGMRSSTENLATIVATAKALRLAWESQEATFKHLSDYRRQIKQIFEDNHWQVFAGQLEQISPHIICAALPRVPGEVMMQAFSNKGIMLSTTSACSSRRKKSFHTLKAMGVEEGLAQSSIRISMSRTTTQNQVDQLIEAIKEISNKFRQDLKGV